MLNLAFARSPGRPLEVLCIGAHCDDIEIGCGGTVLSLQQQHADCRIHWVVLTSSEARRREALIAAKSFVAKPARGEILVHDLPDGLLPAHFAELKARFEAMKAAIKPDLILTHYLDDRHQDHRLIAEVTWQTFRDHLIWEYEIPKYEGDLTTPNLHVPLRAAVATRKLALIARIFASQRGKSWFRSENLEAVMRLRGLESRAAEGYAEAFHCRKSVVGLVGNTAPSKKSRPR